MLENSKRRHATLKQKIEINDLLRKYLRQGEDGYWHYLDGWNDEAIASKVGVNSVNSVSNSRLECFGAVMPAPIHRAPDPRIDDLVRAVENLQRIDAERLRLIGELRSRNDLLAGEVRNSLQFLQESNGEVRDQHNKLCVALSVNRVLDVRSCQVGAPQLPLQQTQPNTGKHP